MCFVIPAQAGTQLSRSFKDETALRVPVGKQVERNLVRWRDLGSRQTCLGTQERRCSRFRQTLGVHTLVWFEQHANMDSAIAREKAIKEWRRAWKVELIENDNSKWIDLYPGLI